MPISGIAFRCCSSGGATSDASDRIPLPQGTIERLIGIACLSPSVGLSEPRRFVIIEDHTRRAAIRANFELCNQDALSQQEPDRASLYTRLKLSGLDNAPGQIGVFSDRATAQGHGLGGLTMPATLDYSAAIAVHTLRSIGVGWVSILDPAKVAEILQVPKEWAFIGHLCIGYPMEEADLPALQREGWERRHPSAGVVIYR